MNVLQISAYDTMGQQFNGLALHRALPPLGIDSSMLVYDRSGNDAGVAEIAGPTRRKINTHTQALERRLSLYSVLNVGGRGLFRTPQYRSADVVHLQMLHARSFFSLLHLPRVAREKHTLWTVHDPWLTTGRCVHPLACERWRTGCGQCPDLTTAFAMRDDRTALNWTVKRRALKGSRLTLVVSSLWMKQRVNESPILAHLPAEVIPFGLDLEIFNPGDKAAARQRLGIPLDADVFCFRAIDLHGAFKGTQYVEQALARYRPRRKTYLITFEQLDGLRSLRDRFEFIELGWVESRQDVAHALQCADILLMPSIAESFGMMAVEAMACGVPVICFEGTALPAVVGVPECGVAVPYLDSAALLNAIEGLVDNPHRRRELGLRALLRAQQEYAFEHYVERHAALYKSLTA